VQEDYQVTLGSRKLIITMLHSSKEKN